MDFDLPEFASSCNVKNGADFAEKCAVLHKYLCECNEHVNLTRLTSEEDFYFKHVADSLLIAQVFPEIAVERFAVAFVVKSLKVSKGFFWRDLIGILHPDPVNETLPVYFMRF